jgi:hypothetical protein
VAYPDRDFRPRRLERYIISDETGRNRRGGMAVEMAVQRRRFTREEYSRMAEVGIQ